MLNGAGGVTQSTKSTVTAGRQRQRQAHHGRHAGSHSFHLDRPAGCPGHGRRPADGVWKATQHGPHEGAIVPFDSFKVDNVNGDSIVRMIGHMVSNAGPLPYANHLAGDNNDPLVDAGTTQFTTTTRGQDNNHGGFYIDNVIIGFAERGEMVTDAAGGTTTFTNPTPAKDVLTKGAYQLQIREAAPMPRGIRRTQNSR